jgi:hypothetical protein
MATGITINEAVTLDESAGLQTGAIATTTEDNNDNDVASLPSAVAARLAMLTAAPMLGAAASASNYVTVTPDGSVNTLNFVTAAGTALPVYSGSASGGVASNLTALDGGTISLFADAQLGSRLVLGVDTNNQIVLAVYLEPATNLTSATVYTAQFEALAHPITTDHDDPLTLTGLGVAAGGSLEFNFNALPSGQNLFGTVGTASAGLIVFGKTVVLNSNGTFTNASNTINTSQGGGPTTIGVNNQMFDAGEGAYFTFVKNPVANFLAGAPGGLDQGEADDADNMQYTGGTLEVNSGFVVISQLQGNATATMKITTYDVMGSPQGRDLTTAAQTPVAITAVRVFDAAGNAVASPQVTLTSGVATVAGLGAGYTVEWDTSAVHDRVLIEGVAGKFDIGGFGTNQPTSTVVPLTGVRFEDDGPSITGTAQGAPTLAVDETTLSGDASGAFAAQFSPVSGIDGPGATPSTYALSTPGGASGLVDTATGEAVNLSLVGGVVEGRTASSNQLVFTVSVSSSGSVTLDQQRAVVHPTANPDESVSLSAANLVVLTSTTFDKEGDNASAAIEIGQLLVFKDDGPSVTATIVGAPTLTVDDSTLENNASGAFAGQFAPVFGADGAGAAGTTYALSTPGGSSGLTDTQTKQAVNLFLNNSGMVEGRTATSNDLVFTVSVNTSGGVTLDQLRSVVHTNTGNVDESTSLSAANLVVLTATAADRDGDSASAGLNIGQLLVFKDDGPTIGPIADSVVDFAASQSATKTLAGAVGADPNTAPYTVTDFTLTTAALNTQLQGILSGGDTVVTYYADTSGDGTFGNAGDTPYYRLTLDQTGAGSYTFDVLANPPASSLEFNFNALPSGQNLFGTVGSAATGLIVFGKTVVLNSDGTFTNASNTINTSQGGGPTTIGVNNQMFDAGEGAYFTFVKNPVANFLAGAPGGLDQGEADDADNMQYTGGTLEVNSGFTVISQIQGNAAATMKITTYNVTGSPQGRDLTTATQAPVAITAVRVLDADGQQVANPQVTLTAGVATVAGLGAGYTVEWDTGGLHDRVLIEAVAGKFDIGGFGTSQPQPTPDQLLTFEATVTDGDGDTALDVFTVGIDGTGIYDDGVIQV